MSPYLCKQLYIKSILQEYNIYLNQWRLVGTDEGNVTELLSASL